MQTVAEPPFAAGLPLAETEVQRESIRQRCDRTQNVLPAMVVALLAIGAMLAGDVPTRALASWLGMVLASTALRTWHCRRVLERIAEADATALPGFERGMYITCVLNSVMVGAGVWLIGAQGTTGVRFVITLLSCLYAVGAMITASMHFQSYAVATVANLGQTIVFWLAHRELGTGTNIAVLLIIILLLLISSGRYNAATFRTTFLVRYENRDLLARLMIEKQEAERGRQSAERANISKSRFLAAASHDLRQPLHALSLYSGALDLQVQEPVARETVHKIQSTIEVLDRLFEGLLDLSSFDANAIEPRLVQVDLRAEFDQLEDEFAPQARERQLGFQVQAPVRWLVRTDPILLQRVLRNLLHNAVRYSGTGTVRLGAQRESNAILVSVSDQGPGLSTADQARIFDELVQLNNPARDRSRGSGLGLALVSRIDRLLGLRLTLESQPGRGSCFTISLPLIDECKVGDAAGTRPGVASLPRLGPELRVVAYEDDPMVRDALVAQLQQWGCAVDCPDLSAELGWLGDPVRQPGDVYLVDDMLGDHFSGLDIAGQLALTVPRHRILIMTGNSDPDRLIEIRQSGFLMLPKPVLPRDLHAALERARQPVPVG